MTALYLTRYLHPLSGEPAVGVELDDGSLHELDNRDLHDLLALGLEDLRTLVASPGPIVTGDVTWLPPVSGRTEVWASGVTYERSREARIEESSVADVYTRVYDADRPELFFKSVAWRVATDGEPIGIRDDSPLNVPEPEVAVVANRFGEVVGYTICNDVSSRSIEGENPLYLPQAKVYAGACSLHRRVRLAWTAEDPGALDVTCTVLRGGAVAWKATTNTRRMKRTFDDLLAWAFRGDHHPDGMVLSTGTGIVPELEFTLTADDVVQIDVTALGTLTNTVRRGRDAFAPVLPDRG
jgi:2-dehydro-3-deoxy-D-arabinonate dehydratase